jgi:hypothetical protein
MQLLQTQSQTSQSLQEQFSCLQTQQSRIFELLAPLHPILQSVPLHIDIARNAIIEKIPEGCQCTKLLSPGMNPPSKLDAELSLISRKRRRISLDSLHSDPHVTLRGYLDLDQRLETNRHQMPHEPVERTVETQNQVQDRRTTSPSPIQTPSGGSSDLTMASGGYPESVTAHSGSGNAALATKLSVIAKKPPPNKTVGGKGIAPPITAFRHPKRAKDNPISYISRVSCSIHTEVYMSYLCAQPPAVPGKRFILFNDDDDDDDDI